MLPKKQPPRPPRPPLITPSPPPPPPPPPPQPVLYGGVISMDKYGRTFNQNHLFYVLNASMQVSTAFGGVYDPAPKHLRFQSALDSAWAANSTLPVTLTDAAMHGVPSRELTHYNESMTQCLNALFQCERSTSVEFAAKNWLHNFQQKMISLAVDFYHRVRPGTSWSTTNGVETHGGVPELKKGVPLVGNVRKVCSYWNELSAEEKRRILEVRISHIKEYYIVGLASVVLLEALDFACRYKTWKFWLCCDCGENFADKDLFLKHAMKTHVEVLSKQFKLVLPPEIDKEYGWKSQTCKVTTESKQVDGREVDLIKERIFFTNNESCLLLDGRLLRGHITPRSDHEAVEDNSSAVISDGHQAEDVFTDEDNFISWLFLGPTAEQGLVVWTGFKEEKISQGIKMLNLLKKEFRLIKSMCDRKCQLLCHDEAFDAVNHVCVQKQRKGKQNAGFVPQSFESLLRERQEKLDEMEKNAMFSGVRVELNVMNNILQEAQALKDNQFGRKETLEGETSNSQKLGDTYIMAAMRRQRDENILKVGETDARITQGFGAMEELVQKFESASAYGYRSIMLVLLQPFMKAHLDNLADKHETEKVLMLQ